jgi:hypothetical protein
MNKLEPHSENPFKSITTSKDSVQKFSYDNYKRMEAAGNPAYAARMVATKDAWQRLFGNLETYDADRNLQQSFTIQLNSKMMDFIDKALELEPLIVYKFKKTSGTYQEFFPHGRTEYLKATQENIFHLMKRMIDGTHRYATELGAGLEAEFTLLRDDFQDIWDLQKEKKGDVAEAIPDFETKVQVMYDELYKNMLVILAENYQNPRAMLSFFDQTLVNYNTHIKTITIQKNSKKAFELNFKVEDIISVTSKFSIPLRFYFGPTEDAEVTDPVFELPPNANLKVKGSVAGAPVNKFIIILNHTDKEAKVKVLLK